MSLSQQLLSQLHVPRDGHTLAVKPQPLPALQRLETLIVGRIESVLLVTRQQQLLEITESSGDTGLKGGQL